MIIKILKPATTFQGIPYSDEKIKRNEAELLSANNFPLEGMGADEQIGYLEFVSNLNPRVKKKQFHATVSARGREHSFKELEKTARKYMEHMGYGEQPFVVYAHRDSPNNHVHIVSTRVDLQGKRIPDAFEKLRTQNFIKKELGIDFSKGTEEILKEAMSYRFKDINALDALLNRHGYTTYIKKGEYHIMKSGKVQLSTDARSLKGRMYRTMFDHKDLTRTKAQLYKYSRYADFDSLKSQLRKKLGLEIIYRYSGDNSEHNWKNNRAEIIGYTVIDHRNKLALTDRVLLPVATLEKEFETHLSKKEIANLMKDIKAGKESYFDVLANLRGLGLSLRRDGTITISNGETVAKLSKEIMDTLRYNQRVSDVNTSLYSGNIKAKDLAEIYRIDPERVVYRPGRLSDNMIAYYKKAAHSYLNRNPDRPRQGNDIFVRRHGTKHILADRKQGTIINLEDDLGIAINIGMSEMIPEVSDNGHKYDYPLHHGALDRVFSEMFHEDMETYGSERKKKRRGPSYNM